MTTRRCPPINSLRIQKVRKIIIALAIIFTLAALAVGGYCFYISSPLYAFHEAITAFQNHDQQLFDKRVDSHKLIDGFLDDLMVEPALSTPGLSEFQSTVASGALAMAKANITNDLLGSLHRALAADNFSRPINTSFWQFVGGAPAYAQTQSITKSAPRAGLRDLMKAVGGEMSSEVSKLKRVAFMRMLSYVHSHPDTVPGKLLDCPPQERSSHVKNMLQDYGLALKDFKGLGGYSTTSDITGRQSATVGFNFYSPKMDRQFTLNVDLIKNPTSEEWQVVRLSNIQTVMDQLEENYRRDIHELVEYSLSGMNDNNMTRDMRGMTARLKQNPAAQNILKNFNINLR